MNPLSKFLCAALLSAVGLAAAPAAQAQVGVNITIGSPAWGPPVPRGAQYYYIPEIDGYYDLYSQQYIVYQDDYWVPLPRLYGYDPYQFHPVVIDYRGREPWRQLEYCHSRYAYRPYQSYGRGRNGYYPGAYGQAGYARGHDNRGYDDRGYDNRNEYYNNRSNRGYDNRGQGQYSGGNRGGYYGQYQNGGQALPDRGGYYPNAPVQGPQPGQPSQGQQNGSGYGRGKVAQGRGGQDDGRISGHSRARVD